MRSRNLAAMCVVTLVLSGCASRPTRIAQPPLGAPAAATTVQALFESGRDDDVVTRAAATAGAEELWFSAQSRLRMGQRAEAIADFTRLANTADRKSTRLNSSHTDISRMPSSA